MRKNTSRFATIPLAQVMDKLAAKPEEKPAEKVTRKEEPYAVRIKSKPPHRFFP